MSVHLFLLRIFLRKKNSFHPIKPNALTVWLFEFFEIYSLSFFTSNRGQKYNFFFISQNKFFRDLWNEKPCKKRQKDIDARRTEKNGKNINVRDTIWIINKIMIHRQIDLFSIKLLFILKILAYFVMIFCRVLTDFDSL